MTDPSNRVAKLATLCKAQGFSDLTEFLTASMADSICPAICMTDGCDYVADMESDQEEGYCEACGSNTVVSALVLAELI
jgi:hypothetical protein